MVVRKYGWRPDKPDHRDLVCNLRAKRGVSKNVDLRTTGHLPPVYDQGQTSSCTGNAIAAAIEYGVRCQGKHVYTPSRLFIYFNERVMENTVDQPDAGAEIRDGIKSVAHRGVVSEDLWPFDINKVTVQPSPELYDQALKNVIKQYSRVPVKLANVQNVLTHGIPVVFGVTLYESFMSDSVAQNGMVPNPTLHEKAIGGHAMLIVGTTDTHFIVRNSWGEGWGDGGYCYISHEYLTNQNLADDFWAIFLA